MTVVLPPTKRPAAPSLVHNLTAVASGKGGVGKTWFAITLTHALARAGRNALLFDGDLGLANVDIQLGLMPPHDLGSVLAGQKSLADARMTYAEGGFDIIAGRSGSGRLANLPPHYVQTLAENIAGLAPRYDHVIIDLGAGVERTVRQLVRGAGTIAVVLTDEPTSLTDAYAFIKTATLDNAAQSIQIVVNMAKSARDGEKTYATLLRACEGFLKLSPPLLGVVRRDPCVRDAIRLQTLTMTRYPMSDVAADMEAIAGALSARVNAARRAGPKTP